MAVRRRPDNIHRTINFLFERGATYHHLLPRPRPLAVPRYGNTIINTNTKTTVVRVELISDGRIKLDDFSIDSDIFTDFVAL